MRLKHSSDDAPALATSLKSSTQNSYLNTISMSALQAQQVHTSELMMLRIRFPIQSRRIKNSTLVLGEGTRLSFLLHKPLFSIRVIKVGTTNLTSAMTIVSLIHLKKSMRMVTLETIQWEDRNRISGPLNQIIQYSLMMSFFELLQL